MTKLSIIIPIYNGERYIKRCLESIVSQDNGKIEVCLIDDGSKDKSAEKCAKYTSQYPFIQYFYKENGGVSSARNLGLQKISGDYVWFVDVDDTIASNAIEEVFSSIGADLTIYNFYRVAQENTLIDLENKQGIYEIVDLNDFFSNYILKYKLANGPLNKIYKTELIKKIGLKFDEDLRIGEDFAFNLIYYKQIKSFEFKSAPIYLYYMVEGSAMHSKNTKVFSYQQAIAEIIKNEYKDILKTDILEQFLLMQLVCGINQSKERGVDKNEIKKLTKKYILEIMDGKRFSKKVVNNFLKSEGAGILSRIKFKIQNANILNKGG